MSSILDVRVYAYCLIRRFASSAEREERLAAFYGSKEWLSNSGDGVAALVDSYRTLVIRGGVIR